jgi:hypothetical protein
MGHYCFTMRNFRTIQYPLLGNNSEISNYTTAFITQLPVNSNRGTMFSVRSLSRWYKQDKLGASVSQLVS